MNFHTTRREKAGHVLWAAVAEQFPVGEMANQVRGVLPGGGGKGGPHDLVGYSKAWTLTSAVEPKIELDVEPGADIDGPIPLKSTATWPP